MSQREQLKNLVTDFCNEKGSRTFTLNELHQKYNDFSVIDIGGLTPQATVRRLLQELRDEQFISFENNSGHYTLRDIELLDDEKSDIQNLNISSETPDKKEYLVETYARKSSWVKAAKNLYGLHCMMDGCKNTFLTMYGVPYIEVHHIIPLYQGGEDGVWNLSVLCAHHHRMAHFAQKKTIQQIQDTLLVKANLIYENNSN